MTKLHQLIAVEKDIKSRTYAEFTALHHLVQKTDLLGGISRTYRKKDDDGDDFPPESKKVQVRADKVLTDAATVLTRLFDVVATKDLTNTTAKADVVVNGTTVLTDVPVSHLLFLEKQLSDLRTFIKKMPVLDAGETWNHDTAADAWATEPVDTTKTKKVPRNHVKAEATDKHPAQVDVYTEDVVVGYWRTVKFSGALHASRVNELLARLDALDIAVKYAREQANSTEVIDTKVGKKVFDYLFGAEVGSAAPREG